MQAIVNVPAKSFYSRYNFQTFEVVNFSDNIVYLDLLGIIQGFELNSIIIVDLAEELDSALAIYEYAGENKLYNLLNNYADIKEILLTEYRTY
jgi:hypothetical protein